MRKSEWTGCININYDESKIDVNPILGGVWHVRWLGGGKFTHPCYLLKYLPKSHQTWQFCCTSDKDQKNIYEVLNFLMTSSYFADDVIKNQCF